MYALDRVHDVIYELIRLHMAGLERCTLTEVIAAPARRPHSRG